MEQNKYKIELTETQCHVVMDALEEYFRINLNQWEDLSRRLGSMNVHISKDNPNRDHIFDLYIQRKNIIQKILMAVGSIADSVVAKIKELGGTASVKENTGDSKPTSVQKIKPSYLFAKDEPLKCPRCGSTIVTTTSRGYSLIWGFAGSNKTVNRCGKCGYTWKP